MAEGTRNLVIAFVLVSLFIFAFVSFGVQFQTDMGANQTILNETKGGLNTTFIQIETQLSEMKSTTNSSRTAVEEEGVGIDEGQITSTSIISTVLTFWSRISGTWQAIKGLFDVFFDKDMRNVFLGAIGTILTITLILYAWKTWRTGT